jgi:hypothetical protein
MTGLNRQTPNNHSEKAYSACKKWSYHELNGIVIFWSEDRSQETEAIADLIAHFANGNKSKNINCR